MEITNIIILTGENGVNEQHQNVFIYHKRMKDLDMRPPVRYNKIERAVALSVERVIVWQ